MYHIFHTVLYWSRRTLFSQFSNQQATCTHVTHCVLASVFAGTTPFAACSLSRELTGLEKRLLFRGLECWCERERRNFLRGGEESPSSGRQLKSGNCDSHSDIPRSKAASRVESTIAGSSKFELTAADCWLS